jgi:hypothetical protein
MGRKEATKGISRAIQNKWHRWSLTIQENSNLQNFLFILNAYRFYGLG